MSSPWSCSTSSTSATTATSVSTARTCRSRCRRRGSRARAGIALVDGAPGRLVLVHAACLETVPQTSHAARLVNLMDLVLDACTELQPDVAAVEELYFSTNRRTAMRVSEARGVVLCALG